MAVLCWFGWSGAGFFEPQPWRKRSRKRHVRSANFLGMVHLRRVIFDLLPACGTGSERSFLCFRPFVWAICKGKTVVSVSRSWEGKLQSHVLSPDMQTQGKQLERLFCRKKGMGRTGFVRKSLDVSAKEATDRALRVKRDCVALLVLFSRFFLLSAKYFRKN